MSKISVRRSFALLLLQVYLWFKSNKVCETIRVVLSWYEAYKCRSGRNISKLMHWKCYECIAGIIAVFNNKGMHARTSKSFVLVETNTIPIQFLYRITSINHEAFTYKFKHKSHWIVYSMPIVLLYLTKHICRSTAVRIQTLATQIQGSSRRTMPRVTKDHDWMVSSLVLFSSYFSF